MILAGDIGGTKTVLGLFERAGEGVEFVSEAEYPSSKYSSLEAIVATFLGRVPGISLQAACFGVAGPVVAGRAKLTNVPWTADPKLLASVVPAPRVTLLNDLQAIGLGALHLQPSDLHVLNEGAAPGEPGNIAVIGAGTGLGEGYLFWDGCKYRPGASEGGHVDFAPRSASECELLKFLQRELGGHVSYERLLSGSGLVRLYRFHRMRSGSAEPDWLRARLASGDAATVISEVGLAWEDPVCVAALEAFAEIYGAEAGNLALKLMALGGVFVGGGIAPKILPELKKGGFMRAFVAKGRFATLLSTIPVKVILDKRVALRGAAYFARDL